MGGNSKATSRRYCKACRREYLMTALEIATHARQCDGRGAVDKAAPFVETPGKLYLYDEHGQAREIAQVEAWKLLGAAMALARSRA